MALTGYIPFAKPCFDELEIAALARVIRRGWVSTGPEAQAFEEELASVTGRRHAVALNSCTAALHLAFLGVGAPEGGEVIVPTVTFTASAAAVLHAGGTPVLVDVEPDTMNISPEAVRRAITPRTQAILAVHFAGRMADMEALASIAAEHDISLLEDAAHTLPAYRNGASAGAAGHAAAFSFFATKPITTGEGGALVTDDDRLEDLTRTWSQHGISRGFSARYLPGGSAGYEVLHPGYKYNMSDLQAALGRVQLAKHQELWRRRRWVAERYRELLGGSPYLDLPPPDTPDDQSSWYLFVIRLRLERLDIDRDAFCAELHAAGIGTSVHFRPLHTYVFYRDNVVRRDQRFPVSDAVYPRVVSLPLYAAMTDEEVVRVARTVHRICVDHRR